LEFDIGFLLDDYFCLTAWHAASGRDFLARTRSMFPDQANAGPRSPQRSLAGRYSVRYGIWYARSKVVKARVGVEVLKTWVT
jgi:hypothetical protein